MASSVALRRLVSFSTIPNTVHGVFPKAIKIAPIVRLFNTDTITDLTRDADNRRIGADTYSDRFSAPRASLLSDAFDPISPTRTLAQVLNMMDQFMDSPFLTRSSLQPGTAARRSWDMRETDDAINLRIDMPGLDKQDVKVMMEHNTLVIRGEGGKEDGEDNARRYVTRIDLPGKVFITDQIKAEMKNGVLKVVVPKVKEGNRTDVVNVKVE